MALKGQAVVFDRIFVLLAKRLPQEVAAAMYQEAEIEMAEMKARTPVSRDGSHGNLPGTLRASGYVQLPEITGNEITVRLGFGGPARSYALYVHEDLEAFHTVGEAKFVESVLLESAPHLVNRIVARVDLSKAAKE